MEGIHTTIMGDIKDLCGGIKPASLLVGDLEYPSGRMVMVGSRSDRKGTGLFPVTLVALKDRSLLCVMADPDQVLGLTLISFEVHVGFLDCFRIFLSCVITSSGSILDRSYPAGEHAVIVPAHVSLRNDRLHDCGLCALIPLSATFGKGYYHEVILGVLLELVQKNFCLPGCAVLSVLAAGRQLIINPVGCRLRSTVPVEDQSVPGVQVKADMSDSAGHIRHLQLQVG